MIPVSEIYDEARKLVGTCDETSVFRRINRAIEILANKSDWDPLVGDLDIVCEDSLITLPRDIEIPLSVSYAGFYPALGRNRLFHYHLNGPGNDSIQVGWRWWQDRGDAVTFRSLSSAAKVAAIPEKSEDDGKTITIYGYDSSNNEIRFNGSRGYQIILGSFEAPSSSGGSGSSGANTIPTFSRIEKVSKQLTSGPVQLWSLDDNGSLDTLLAVYDWDDTQPVFRRLKIDRASADAVSIHYRKRNFKVRSKEDLIPLHSAEAVVMMIRALRYYDEIDFATAESCEVTAMRWLTEEQLTRTPPIGTPIQVAGPKVRDDDIN